MCELLHELSITKVSSGTQWCKCINLFPHQIYVLFNSQYFAITVVWGAFAFWSSRVFHSVENIALVRLRSGRVGKTSEVQFFLFGRIVWGSFRELQAFKTRNRSRIKNIPNQNIHPTHNARESKVKFVAATVNQRQTRFFEWNSQQTQIPLN